VCAGLLTTLVSSSDNELDDATARLMDDVMALLSKDAIEHYKHTAELCVVLCCCFVLVSRVYVCELMCMCVDEPAGLRCSTRLRG
jgi:hypothetical protein